MAVLRQDHTASPAMLILSTEEGRSRKFPFSLSSLLAVRR